ncbi:hypothetical protein LINPERHAP1_LOCUS27290 [Linum perenne]
MFGVPSPPPRLFTLGRCVISMTKFKPSRATVSLLVLCVPSLLATVCM